MASLAAVAVPADAHSFRFHHSGICAAANPFDAVAGTPFSGPVATFTVRDPFADADDFRAFVKWGDGTKSGATIEQQPSGGFVVDAAHTYSEPGTFYTTVFIVRPWRGFAVVHGTAMVLQAAPAVTGISPASGPEAGGTTLTITGADLTNATDVKFGNTSAFNFTVDNPTQITATAPAGIGTVDITVTTPGGTSASNDADQYSYIPAPTVTGVGPTFGPEAGGTTVTITGTDFSGGDRCRVREYGGERLQRRQPNADHGGRPGGLGHPGCDRHDAERHERRQPRRPLHLHPRPCHHRD